MHCKDSKHNHDAEIVSICGTGEKSAMHVHAVAARLNLKGIDGWAAPGVELSAHAM
jgi:hypothetical protein